MKCHYCDCKLDDLLHTGVLYCANHRNIKYVCSGSLEKCTVLWIDMTFGHYCLTLDLQKGKCYLFNVPIGDNLIQESMNMMTLNYLPPITPENVGEWVVRLLNLKAFS